jgi:predicted nucleic acid-binding protein
MNLEAVIRELVQQEKNSEVRLKLSQVALKTGVDYKRLWQFMRKNNPGRLSATEAQMVYEKLTGKPLLPSDNV